ncbi:hypothetical protein E2562_006743 [Oryza meyeriana var. granulata]|uniref:Uncharacterized protein n=1 Tax=Oryza meyeriana var. granulata TaxID=110450 RepID=A0A6G1EGC6_9ORYZ|nr:hypothetical protein E2562_006743 [Oryza meyeriana var. granulata]
MPIRRGNFYRLLCRSCLGTDVAQLEAETDLISALLDSEKTHLTRWILADFSVPAMQGGCTHEEAQQQPAAGRLAIAGATAVFDGDTASEDPRLSLIWSEETQSKHMLEIDLSDAQLGQMEWLCVGGESSRTIEEVLLNACEDSEVTIY